MELSIAKGNGVIDITMRQHFLCASDFFMLMRTEYGIELPPQVVELIKRIDFKSSYKKELKFSIVNGEGFEKAQIFLPELVNNIDDLELDLKVPDPVIACLLLEAALNNKEVFSDFIFINVMHKNILECDSLDCYLTVDFAGKNPTLIKYCYEPLPQIGWVSALDGYAFQAK